MQAFKTILTIIQLLSSVSIILIVMFQSGKDAGLSAAIGGGSSDTFLSKNKGGTTSAKLAKATKWIALVFFVLTLILNLIHA